MRFNHKENPYSVQDGKCSFKVIMSEDRKNPFDQTEEINLKIKVTDPTNKSADFFVSLNEKKPWIIKAFCLASGIPMEVFESDNLSAAQCMNKEGDCIMGTYKNKEGEDKCGLRSWVKRDDVITSSSATKQEEPPFPDDDVPF